MLSTLRRAALRVLRAVPVMALVCVPAATQINSLTFRPSAIEYSASLDKLVMVAGAPNQLHIYDPNTKSDVAVGLPLAPLSLSVSPDGLYAAVGHDAYISYVNLSTGQLVRTYTVSVKVLGLVLGSQYLYILPDRTINLATGAESNASYYTWGVGGRMHPNGQWIYNTRGGSPDDVQRFDVSSGTLSYTYDSPYHGDHPICGNVWLSADGSRLFNACATVFQTSSVKEQDMLYFGGLNESIQIVSLHHSAALNKIVTISNPYQYYSGPLKTSDSEVQIYDYEYMTHAGKISLPKFTAGAATYAAHGKFVTYSADSKKLYVVMQADAASGLNHDFGVYVAQWLPAGNCNLSLSASSTPVSASAAAATTQVTATDACIWEATTPALWIHLSDGRFGAGSMPFAYRVAENLSTAARSGSINFGPVPFNISQAAAAVSANPLSRLPFSPVAAAFSTTLDSIIAVSNAPRELHIFNPLTKVDRIVPLTLPATSVAVSQSGLFAAVGHDGWVSYVNLNSGTVQQLYKTSTVAGNLVLGGYGYIYVFPQRDQWEPMHSINLTTGVNDTSYSIYAGIKGALHPSGKYFYTTDSWMEKYEIVQGKPAMVRMNTSASGCGSVWFFTDGGRMLNGCGVVLRSSEIEQQDMAYAGTLSESSSSQGSGVVAASHSGVRKLLAVVHGWSYTTTGMNKITYYNDDYLGYDHDDTIPSFSVDGQSYAARGRWLFWSADSSRLYALVQSDASANLVADFALLIITPSTPVPSCSYTGAAAKNSFAADGGSSSITITAGTGCAWQAVSTAGWISITSGGAGSANGQVSFAVSSNTTTAQRTGTILVGGQTITISQAGATSTSGTVGLGGLFPVAGSTAYNPFTATFTHTGGASQHYLGYILLLPTPNIVWFTAKGSCLIEYNRVSNGVRLINDAGDNWLGGLSGIPIGPKAGTLSNSVCSVDVSQTKAWITGNNMIVQAPVVLKSAITPVLGTFLQALDVNGNWTDMRQFGNWVLSTATPKAGLSIGGMSPASHYGANALYSVQVLHSIDASRISEVHLRFNTQIVGGVPCHAIYFPLSNTLNLVNDAGSGLVSVSGAALGSTGPLSNSYCTIDPSGAAKSSTASALTVNIPVSFNKQTFGGVKNVYVNAFDTTGSVSHWVQAGTAAIQ